MPKRRTIASIDAQMREVKQKMTAVKQRYDRLRDDLATLQVERDSLMAHVIVETMNLNFPPIYHSTAMEPEGMS